MKLPVAVVISGRGSNMEAIARAAQAPGSRYEVVRVIADRETAGGLALRRVPGRVSILAAEVDDGPDAVLPDIALELRRARLGRSVELARDDGMEIAGRLQTCRVAAENDP